MLLGIVGEFFGYSRKSRDVSTQRPRHASNKYRITKLANVTAQQFRFPQQSNSRTTRIWSALTFGLRTRACGAGNGSSDCMHQSKTNQLNICTWQACDMVNKRAVWGFVVYPMKIKSVTEIVPSSLFHHVAVTYFPKMAGRRLQSFRYTSDMSLSL